MHLSIGRMKILEKETGTLIEAVKAMTEIGDELSVPNRPLPKCNGCQYRLVYLTINRQECFYQYIEKTSEDCKVNNNEI
jgi:hypothetical protein